MAADAPALTQTRAPQALACRPGAAVAFHVTFGLGYVGACARCSRRLLSVPLALTRTFGTVAAAYLYGGKALLLLALAAGSYALSTLVAGRRAGCAQASMRRAAHATHRSHC